jgi:hypothetical protein
VSAVANTNLNGFHKNFNVVKNDAGEVTEIRVKGPGKFSLAMYLSYILRQLKVEQAKMQNKADYEYEVRALLDEFEEDIYFDKQDGRRYRRQRSDHIVNSMFALKDLDIERVFADKKFKNVIADFERRLKKIFSSLDPRVISNIKDPKYFVRKKQISQAARAALKLAKKVFSNVPILNTISYIIVEVETMVNRTRTYNQNMLLHYLENFKASELGMTHEEANKAISSIYESRIPWFAFWETNLARSNWEKYGVSKFFAEIRLMNNRLRTTRGRFDEMGQRLNFAFSDATYKGKRVIINVFDKNNQFSSLPAIAHYYDKPAKIKRLRTILQLASLGVSFIPFSDSIKNIVHRYIKSFYDNQMITEGSLYAHFESTDNEIMKNVFKSQFLNPFNPIFH